MTNFEKLFGHPTGPMYYEKPSFAKFPKVEELVHKDWFISMQTGIAFYTQGRYQDALNLYDKAIKLNPSNLFIYKLRASANEGLNNPKTAIEDYKYVLSQDDESYTIYNQIALSFFKLNEFKKSLIAFDITIELKNELLATINSEENIPTVVDGGVVTSIAFERIYANRANVKLSLQDFEGCSDDCVMAIQYNSEYANSYLIAGLLYAKVNDDNKAFQFLKEAEKLGSNKATLVIKQLYDA